MPATGTRFPQELAELRCGVLAMGSMVEQTIGEAMRALIDRDTGLARRVVIGDHEINELHHPAGALLQVHDHPPAGAPGRPASGLSFQHIVLELERMADHAAHVARAAIQLNTLPPLDASAPLPDLAALTRAQVTAILRAVVDADEGLAREIAGRDDDVDTLYRRLWRELVASMADPANVERAATLLFVAKNLERIADRVTNIAEDVVFLHTGHVVELG